MKHCHSCHALPTDHGIFCAHCGAHRSNELGGTVAHIGRRIAAVAIDGAAIQAWYYYAIWGAGMGRSEFLDPPYSPEENLFLAGTLGYAIAVFWLTFTGRSIGKALLGLRVINAEGKVASFPWLVLRETVGKAVSLAPVGCGYFAAFFHPERRALHDQIARTYVVYHDVEERRRLKRRTRPSAGRRRRQNAA